jgi:nucleoside-diphosphate-sugar epimerase
LINTCEGLGVGYTILRPTIIYDEGRDQNITRLARLIKKFGFFPLSGNGAGLRQPVSAKDVANGAIQASLKVAAINRIYALPGGETISYREMVGRIFDSLGKPRRIVSIPPRIWGLASLLAKPFMQNFNSSMGIRMSKDMTFDGYPAYKDFGWDPREFYPRFENLKRV